MPANARSNIIDEGTSGYYHCINRCVRRAFLCGKDPYTGENFDHRKSWFTEKIQNLSEIFLIDIGNYVIMSNHYHINLRNRPDLVAKLSDREVLIRWWKLFPGKMKPNTGEDKPPEYVFNKWLENSEFIEERRRRLSSISWFMRCLNESIARRANREDKVTGRFWQGRFYSQVLLDQEAVVQAAAYIDLNPFRAGLEEKLGTYQHSSLFERMKNIGRNRPGFLSTFSAVATVLADETPFLLLDEKEYIDLVYFYASKQGREQYRALEKGFQGSPTAVGSREKLQTLAEKMGKSRIKGLCV